MAINPNKITNAADVIFNNSIQVTNLVVTGTIGSTMSAGGTVSGIPGGVGNTGPTGPMGATGVLIGGTVSGGLDIIGNLTQGPSGATVTFNGVTRINNQVIIYNTSGATLGPGIGLDIVDSITDGPYLILQGNDALEQTLNMTYNFIKFGATSDNWLYDSQRNIQNPAIGTIHPNPELVGLYNANAVGQYGIKRGMISSMGGPIHMVSSGLGNIGTTFSLVDRCLFPEYAMGTTGTSLNIMYSGNNQGNIGSTVSVAIVFGATGATFPICSIDYPGGATGSWVLYLDGITRNSNTINWTGTFDVSQPSISTIVIDEEVNGMPLSGSYYLSTYIANTAGSANTFVNLGKVSWFPPPYDSY